MTFAGWTAAVPSMPSTSNASRPPCFAVSQRPSRHPPPCHLSPFLLLLLNHLPQTPNSGRLSQPLSLHVDARASLSQLESFANISTDTNIRSWCLNAMPACSISIGAQTAQGGFRGVVGTTTAGGTSKIQHLRLHPTNCQPLKAKGGGHLRKFWTTWGWTGRMFHPRLSSSTGQCSAIFPGARGGLCVPHWPRSSTHTPPPATQWPSRQQV